MTTLPLPTSSRVPAASLVPGDVVGERGIARGEVVCVVADPEYTNRDRCVTVVFRDRPALLLHADRRVVTH
jgi:hypothetical protein